MKTVLTTYIESADAIKIEEEARALGLTKSDYLARIVTNPSLRRIARARIKREQAKAVAA